MNRETLSKSDVAQNGHLHGQSDQKPLVQTSPLAAFQPQIINIQPDGLALSWGLADRGKRMAIALTALGFTVEQEEASCLLHLDQDALDLFQLLEETIT